MKVRTLLPEVVNQLYNVAGTVVQPLVEEDWRLLYRIERAGASPCLLRAYSHPGSRDRQERLVAVLELLEAHGYPAPRLIRTRSGAAVAEIIEWHIVVTTFIEGTVVAANSPNTLRQLAEALGQLHGFSTSLPTTTLQALPMAAWTSTSQFVPFALQEMRQIAAVVPGALQDVYETILGALQSLPTFTDLPEALLHNDCVPTNAVVTEDDRLILIDWADAGRGPMVIDLGWLLVQCDGGTPRTPPLKPDTERLDAVIDGYCRHRIPTAAENAAMLDALRFAPTVGGALAFAATLRGESSEYPWQLWWERYQAAAEAAPLVQERIASYQRRQNTSN